MLKMEIKQIFSWNFRTCSKGEIYTITNSNKSYTIMMFVKNYFEYIFEEIKYGNVCSFDF